MEEAGMVSQLRSEANGMRALGKADKVYLDNTNLVYGLAREHPNKGNIRETFFLNQLRVADPIVSSKMSDFASIEMRDYQNKMFDKTKDKNSIILLETGTGKTLIAFKHILHILDKYNG